MLIKNKVIVLNTIKFKDNDLIVKCYTQNHGICSYLIKGGLKSRKGSNKLAYFQPLSQLQIEERYRQNRSLQYISELKLDVTYQSLHTNIYKSSIAMFLAEVLSSVLREEEQNKSLFDYLSTSLYWLDQEEHFANFHLIFLLHLTKYLGFFPDTKNSHLNSFNLSTGSFEQNPHPLYSISKENITVLKQLLGINFDALETVKLKSEQRQSILNMLLLYFELHLPDFKKPKSLSVLNHIFK